MLKQIYSVLDKRQRRNACILLFATLIGSFLELLGVSAIMPLVTVVTDNSVIETNPVYSRIADIFNLHDPRMFVVAMALFLIGVYVVKNLYICMRYDVQYRFTYNSQRKLSTIMLNYYVHQDYLFHTNTNVSVLERNIGSDVNFCFDALLNMLSFANEAIVVVVLMVYLAVVDPISTFTMAGILILFFLMFVLFFKRYSVKLGHKTRQAAAVQSKWLLQSFAGIKEIIVMNKEDYFIDNFDTEMGNYSDIRRKQAFVAALPKPVMETVCIGGLLGIMTVKIVNGGDMAQFVPILSVFAVAAFRMLPSINRLSACYSAIMYSKTAVESVHKVVMEMRENQESIRQIESDDFVFEIKEGVKIQNLSFKYPGGDDDVIADANMEIRKLKSTALIGPSGAGKSTMADLILGVLVPNKGSITADGVNIHDHIASWHNKIGYIPQVIYLMDDTVRANVAFGVPRDKVDDERVWKALKEAQLDEFVRSNPGGLDAQVGDRGVRISGGQRQRIGIARALYTDPEILVLDEATSALDNETETAVMEAIDALHGSRTMIIIAHRLTTIRNCDYIYQVADKKVSLVDKSEVL